MGLIGLLIIGFQLLSCAVIIGLLLVRPERLALIPHAPIWTYGLRMLGAVLSFITLSVFPFALAASMTRGFEAFTALQSRKRLTLRAQAAMWIGLVGILAVLVTRSPWLLLGSELLPVLLLVPRLFQGRK
jgi:hypothetical protein